MKKSNRLTFGVAIFVTTALFLQLACGGWETQAMPQQKVAVNHIIPVDTANRMILSYLNSIDYSNNTKEIRSFITDTESLLDYLDDSRIKKVKIFLAHNLDYINAGYEGQRPKANQNALTLVIAGLDSADHYVATESAGVFDQLNPCPDQCVGPITVPVQ